LVDRSSTGDELGGGAFGRERGDAYGSKSTRGEGEGDEVLTASL
jgi:hypothetical protein